MWVITAETDYILEGLAKRWWRAEITVTTVLRNSFGTLTLSGPEQNEPNEYVAPGGFFLMRQHSRKIA